MVGYLCYSLAGNDAGKVYYIVSEEKKYILICDGDKIKIDYPKRKNKKHIQIVKKYKLQDMIQIDSEKDISNENISKICKIVKKDIQEVK